MLNAEQKQIKKKKHLWKFFLTSKMYNKQKVLLLSKEKKLWQPDLNLQPLSP